MKTCKYPSDRCKIQEFDFDIFYEARYLNEAETFSRSPGLVVQEELQRQLVDLQGPMKFDAQLADS